MKQLLRVAPLLSRATAVITLLVVGCAGEDAPASPTDAGFDAGVPEGGRPRTGPGRSLSDEVYTYAWTCTGVVAPTGTPIPVEPTPDDCTTGVWPDLDALTRVCPTFTTVTREDPVSGTTVPPSGDARMRPGTLPVAESGSFAPMPRPATWPATLKVVAWNVEYTSNLDAQIITLTTHPDLRDADVYLLGEVDRCSTRNGVRRAARLLAETLEGDYVYGIEFVELSIDRVVGGDTGQAIVSRRPLSGAAQTCHSGDYDWLASDQPRLGARTAVHADVPIGDTSVRLYAVHFESNDVLGELRAGQVKEALDDAQALACDRPIVIGGDFNAWYATAPELYVLESSGFVDALKVAGDDESTHGGLRLDYVFARGFRVTGGAVVRGLEQSDHDPVWTTLALE